jgi:hypothetical protein
VRQAVLQHLAEEHGKDEQGQDQGQYPAQREEPVPGLASGNGPPQRAQVGVSGSSGQFFRHFQ